MPPAQAAPPTVTPSPGYDARLQEQRRAAAVYQPEAPAAKPALAEIKALAGADRRLISDDYSWIDVQRDDFYSRPRANLERLYRKFCALYPETGS